MRENGPRPEGPEKSVLKIEFGKILDPNEHLRALKGGAAELRKLLSSVE